MYTVPAGRSVEGLSYDPSNVPAYAKDFAIIVKAKKLPPASIQEFLVRYDDDPKGALAEAPEWYRTELEYVHNTSKKQPRKAPRRHAFAKVCTADGSYDSDYDSEEGYYSDDDYEADQYEDPMEIVNEKQSEADSDDDDNDDEEEAAEEPNVSELGHDWQQISSLSGRGRGRGGGRGHH